ncbi:hypothetical protein [Billgrantia desiderata]|uniref:hypothetical protein n=1 Tax=Billgrantia desiderata TaxID=52021 RepID=UPI0013593A98|nr:hypothetical protein [Halomonas desiderata]
MPSPAGGETPNGGATGETGGGDAARTDAMARTAIGVENEVRIGKVMSKQSRCGCQT